MKKLLLVTLMLLPLITFAKCRHLKSNTEVPIIFQGTIISAENEFKPQIHKYTVEVTNQLKSAIKLPKIVNFIVLFRFVKPSIIRFAMGQKYIFYFKSIDKQGNGKLYGDICGHWGSESDVFP